MRLPLSLVCLILLVSACGAGPQAPDTTGQSPTAGGVMPSAAGPASLPTPVGPRSGSIQGTVAVPAHVTARVFVVAGTLVDQLISGQASAVTPVQDDGAFTLSYLAPGAYYVAAFLDTNNDGSFLVGTEPYVMWPDRVPVDGLTPTTGIVLANFLDLADPAVRTPERLARVEALRTNAEAAVQDLLGLDLPAAADAERLLPTLRVTVADALRQWATAAGEHEAQYVEGALSHVPKWAAAAKRGENPLAGRHGWQQFGFVRAIDSAVVPYLLYVPPDARPDEPLPLVVSLHGGGGTHWTGARLAVGEGTLAARGPNRRPDVWPLAPTERMYILAPIGDRSASILPWHGYGEINVLTALDHVTGRYAVDENRIYVTGASDGGTGSWWFGVRYPDRFAAIYVVSGATGGMLPFAMNVSHVPMRVVHGTHDRILPVGYARSMVEQVQQFNGTVEYEEVDRGHNVTDLCYTDGAALRWLAQYTRKPVPPVVQFRTDDLRRNEGPGMLINEIGVPNQPMDVMIRWSAPARVEIDSRNVAALTVRVSPDAEGPVTIRWNTQTLHMDEPAAAIALRADVDADGEVVWSAAPVPLPERRALGPWAGMAGSLSG